MTRNDPTIIFRRGGRGLAVGRLQEQPVRLRFDRHGSRAEFRFDRLHQCELITVDGVGVEAAWQKFLSRLRNDGAEFCHGEKRRDEAIQLDRHGALRAPRDDSDNGVGTGYSSI